MVIGGHDDAGAPPLPGAGDRASDGDRPELDDRGGDDTQAGSDAFRRGLGLLVRREQSRRELTRKLTRHGIAVADAAAAVDRLAGHGYQDDARFAAAFARDRAAGGYGPNRIRADLAGHGLGDEQIAAALAACEADWTQRAAAVAARRFRPAELADPARRRRAVDFLLRRGFDAATAAATVRRQRDPDAD